MEALIELRGLISELSKKLVELRNDVSELNNILNSTAASLRQRDQIASLHALKARVMKEVQNEQMAESEAERYFNRSKIITGIASFPLDSFIGAALNQKNPLSIGAKMFSKGLDKKAPFGHVLITIVGKAAIDDINVISASRLARERERTESEITSSLRDKKLLLLSPERFCHVLDLLEKELINGADHDFGKALIELAKPRISRKKSSANLLETN